MNKDKYFKDGQTIEAIYKSFEKRKKERRAKAKLFLNQNNKIIDKIARSDYSPLLCIPIGAIYFWLLFTI
jgi:hypothetical protein